MKIVRPRDLDAAASPAPAPARLITRRNLLVGSAGLIAAAGAIPAYAGLEALTLSVTRYRLTPPRWPAGRKLTITVIADLHAGGPNMGLARVREVVEVANALRSDVVLLLGDYFATHRFVTERVPHPAWAGELARLKARLGTWAIFGNHDWWYDIVGVRQALAAVKIPVMENDAVLLGEPGEKFWLTGIGDQIAIRLGHYRYRGFDDLPGTLARTTTDDPVILMVHEPDIFVNVPERVSLTLAGHTHGGQIRLPFVWPTYVPSGYGARFAYGHIVEQGRHMIVSGGLGTSIVPARLGVPPEIVRIDLG
jgi:predicted MPP superfamily phosphohydrolase